MSAYRAFVRSASVCTVIVSVALRLRLRRTSRQKNLLRFIVGCRKIVFFCFMVVRLDFGMMVRQAHHRQGESSSPQAGFDRFTTGRTAGGIAKPDRVVLRVLVVAWFPFGRFFPLLLKRLHGSGRSSNGSFLEIGLPQDRL